MAAVRAGCLESARLPTVTEKLPHAGTAITDTRLTCANEMHCRRIDTLSAQQTTNAKLIDAHD